MEFLDEANASQKKLGHNKLQVELEAAQRELVKLKQSDDEKEMKLNLYKKTIASLQSQLQEQSNKVLQLQEALKDPSGAKQNTELQNELQASHEERQALQNEVNDKNVLLKLLQETVGTLQGEKQQAAISLRDMEQELSTIKGHLDEQVAMVESLTAAGKVSEQTVQMHMNMTEHLQKETQVLKEELVHYRSEHELLLARIAAEQNTPEKVPETDPSPKVKGVTRNVRSTRRW